MPSEPRSPVLAPLPRLIYEPIVRLALAEDLGLAGDVTSAGALAPHTTLRAGVIARAEGRLAGLAPAALACELIDPLIRFAPVCADGDKLAAGAVVAVMTGPAQSVLSAERTVLNFLGPLSGVASLTARYVAAVAGTGAAIACTRKTLPGLRALQKFAVRAGGGVNHRMSLADAILIKDNHIAAAGGAATALTRARAFAGHLQAIEIEVDQRAQLAEILALGPEFWPDAILFDNFTVEALTQAVGLVRAAAGRSITLEASGGVTLASVRAIAATGIDLVSVGALTHSAPVLDLGLDMDFDQPLSSPAARSGRTEKSRR